MRLQRGALVKSYPDAVAQDGPSDLAPAWRFAELADQAALSDLAARTRAALELRHFAQDIEWRALDVSPGDQILALIDADENGVQGFVSVHAHDATIDFGLAGVTPFRKRLKRFDVYEAVATRRRDAAGAITGALVALAARMPRSAAVFLEAVPVGSDLCAVLEEPNGALRRTFHVLPWATTMVARIRWPGTVDDYLKSVGKDTRRNLKRTSTDLMSDPTVRCDVRRFETPADVDRFLREGILVSDKTYQKKLLGRGLSAGGKVETQIRFAAARRAFLGYILYIDDAPVAFQYGFLYGGTCFAEQTGYDPEWASRHVGSVLFFESLRDLETIESEIAVLDYGQGMTLFKQRTTNERQEVAHYYLFTRTTSGFGLYHAAKAMIRAKNLLSRVLEKLRLRDRVRAVMRRLTGHGHMR